MTIEKKRLRIGILFGGRSGEHEVSLISAASFGCIDRLDAIRNCASLSGLTGGADRGAGNSSANGARWSGPAGFNPSCLRTSTGVPG